MRFYTDLTHQRQALCTASISAPPLLTNICNYNFVSAILLESITIMSDALHNAFERLHFKDTNDREHLLQKLAYHYIRLHSSIGEVHPKHIKDLRGRQLTSFIDNITIDFMRDYGKRLWPIKRADRQHLLEPRMNCNWRSFAYETKDGRSRDGMYTMLSSKIGKPLRAYFRLLIQEYDGDGDESRDDQKDQDDLVEAITTGIDEDRDDEDDDNNEDCNNVANSATLEFEV